MTFFVIEGQHINDRFGAILVYENGRREFHPYSGGAPITLYNPK
ncbi:MAG: hypothetical protein ACKO0Z_11890 [Betaproteobacteria bacterium]